ncbi:MAG TPA: STAS domain-containing protein [Gemmatimonadales bacterium]|jgi:rsbT co-antagonist protein RsbR|nr:STAS domain-containing protein [Gemmatimonadales bacterium]
MPPSQTSALAGVLQKDRAGVLQAWMQDQQAGSAARPDLMPASEVQDQASQLLDLLAAAVGSGEGRDGSSWQALRQFLASISTSRAAQGFSPVETAAFVLSVKQPLFTKLQQRAADPGQLPAELWAMTTLIDDLALQTTAVTLEARDRMIARQQEEMLELSTPVVKLWDGILALPMIGTLDSARTQVVMESLLQRIVQTGAEVAIIDITGVPTVDTLVAQHLIKTVTAARLMGADCIISGIRPQIAATIVHLGVDLTNVDTKATLADAFRLALRRTGHALGKSNGSERA